MAWGTSVLASALVAGLAERTDLDVVQVEATLPAVLAAVRRRRTHAVVCDLASVNAADVLALLAGRAGLRVVIVDPNADRALAVTGRRPRMRTLDDLVASLIARTGDQEVQHGRRSEPRCRAPRAVGDRR